MQHTDERRPHEGREDGDHEGSEGAGAEGLEEVEPARLVSREILERMRRS